MPGQLHRIDNLVMNLDLALDGLDYNSYLDVARDLFIKKVLPQVEPVLDSISDPDTILSLDCLELDLGDLESDDWEMEFVQKSLELIEDGLAKYFQGSVNEWEEKGIRVEKVGKRKLDNSIGFLESGYVSDAVERGLGEGENKIIQKEKLFVFGEGKVAPEMEEVIKSETESGEMVSGGSAAQGLPKAGTSPANQLSPTHPRMQALLRQAQARPDALTAQLCRLPIHGSAFRRIAYQLNPTEFLEFWTRLAVQAPSLQELLPVAKTTMQAFAERPPWRQSGAIRRLMTVLARLAALTLQEPKTWRSTVAQWAKQGLEFLKWPKNHGAKIGFLAPAQMGLPESIVILSLELIQKESQEKLNPLELFKNFFNQKNSLENFSSSQTPTDFSPRITFSPKSNPGSSKIDNQEILRLVSKPVESPSDQRALFLPNTGICLIHVFLPRFFERLGWTKEGQFIHEAAQMQAIYTLHYLATFNEEAAEEELALMKLICGLGIEDNIYLPEPLSLEIKTECRNLLTAVLQHWEAMEGTSPEGLQEAFLRRPGKLSTGTTGFSLKVESFLMDVLIDRLPWGLAMVKLPWMRDLLYVEWC